MGQLDKQQKTDIKTLCAEGYALYDAGDMRLALRKFYQAWLIFPKPQTDFPEAGWVLTAMGDTYFRNAKFEEGKEALISALHCDGMIDNPFIHLRLGQCFLEIGNNTKASTHLGIAYERGGRKIFEKEAPKYLIAALQPDSL